jgi:enoyl-CoA hydratase/carnithine racemase
VLACDLRIAVPEAKFFYPVMKLGFLPQPSDPGRLARLIGPARAKMILMAGRKLPADEAMSWGLLDLLSPASEMEAAIAALSADALSAEPGHISAIKSMV